MRGVKLGKVFLNTGVATSLRGSAQRFLRNRAGSVAVEFTLVAVLLLALVLAILETGVTFLLGFSIENLSQQLARKIQTGRVQQLGVATAADLKSKVICPSSGGGLLPPFVDCNNLIIDLRSAASYGSNPSIYFYRQPLQFCPAASGQVLVLRVAYGLPVFLPPLALGNAVFGPSAAGIVDDYPGAVGWTHLLADAMAFQVEKSSSDASATGGSAGSSGASASGGC